MEAYDAAVLSYALATAASKLKPGLLGAPPTALTVPQKFNEEISLTPPTRQEPCENNPEQTKQLYQLLSNLEQIFISKGVAQLADLLEICSCKQVRGPFMVIFK